VELIFDQFIRFVVVVDAVDVVDVVDVVVVVVINLFYYTFILLTHLLTRSLIYMTLYIFYIYIPQECDAHAVRSQQTWALAKEQGLFDAEIAPIEIPGKKRGTTIMFDTDEHPRPDATVEGLAKLPAVFDRKTGVVTAANASGINDGAGSIIVASERAVKEHNLKPLCRLVSYGIVGCDPTVMGLGPVPAIKEALKRAGDLSLHNDVDRIEINEAFAAQFLACAKELDLDMHKTNIHGSAIAIGHPLGASGSRITAHLAHEFAYNPNSKIHVGAACIGGGQGIAVVLERV
jgi:acetyl-CoA acyltransferase 2